MRDGYLTITDRKKELLKDFRRQVHRAATDRAVDQELAFRQSGGGNRQRSQVRGSALIVPDWEQLEAYAKLKGLNLNTRAEFCRHPRIIDLFERQIAARTQNLAQFEKIKRIALLDQELTVEGGEMTPTLKVKRRVVDQKYRDVIDRIYSKGSDKVNGPSTSWWKFVLSPRSGARA